jgi:mRNA-degrading endonuclease RelE of RelBE toxin-antitoxin system
MYKRVVFTEKFSRSLKRLSEPMQQLVAEKINYLKQNPAHPSLNVHRVLRVRSRKMWICYIGDSLRLLYQPQADVLYLWDVGAHVVVDRIDRRRFK